MMRPMRTASAGHPNGPRISRASQKFTSLVSSIDRLFKFFADDNRRNGDYHERQPNAQPKELVERPSKPSFIPHEIV